MLELKFIIDDKEYIKVRIIVHKTKICQSCTIEKIHEKFSKYNKAI